MGKCGGESMMFGVYMFNLTTLVLSSFPRRLKWSARLIYVASALTLDWVTDVLSSAST